MIRIRGAARGGSDGPSGPSGLGGPRGLGGHGRRARRIGAIGAVAVLLGLCLGAAGCSSSGSKAAGDVRITGCSRDATSHRAVVRGTINNSSSKRRTYTVQVDVKANDSKIETGVTSVLRVAPHGNATFTIHALGADVPSGTNLTCSIARVGRITT